MRHYLEVSRVFPPLEDLDLVVGHHVTSERDFPVGRSGKPESAWNKPFDAKAQAWRRDDGE